jgi:gas vesicle protein
MLLEKEAMVESQSDRWFGVGLIFGTMLGLTAGILYAPRRGEETRILLREKAETVKEKAEQVIDNAKERAQSLRHKTEEEHI